MPVSIRAHLATTPDSTSLESLAILSDRALASETDVKDSSVGVAKVRVNDNDNVNSCNLRFYFVDSTNF